MATYDVLVAGELNPDLILSDPNLMPEFGQVETLVESTELTIGSSSAIFACGAARLGLKVAFIGVVGEDLFGRFMLKALEQRGIDMSPSIISPTQKTGLSVILSRGTDRAILTHLGAINALQSDMVHDDLLRKARHLHVASYFLQTALQPGLADLFQRARSLGLTTSLDTNWDPSGAWKGIDTILPLTDVFLPNEAEALALSGETSVEAALIGLSQTVPVIAVKLGGQGAIARQGKEIARAPAISVLIVDTVGAGDSFDAGFVYGHFHHWPLLQCLQLGIACGSLSLRDHGGTQGQPDLQTAMQYVSEVDTT